MRSKRSQASKMSRAARKATKYYGLGANVGHRSHMPVGDKRYAARISVLRPSSLNLGNCMHDIRVSAHPYIRGRESSSNGSHKPGQQDDSEQPAPGVGGMVGWRIFWRVLTVAWLGWLALWVAEHWGG